MNKILLKLVAVLFSVLFFALSVTALVVPLFVPDKEYSETENRYLAAFPPISVDSVLSGEFMSAFETYLSDQFSFRDTIMTIKTYISRIMGTTEINGVYAGRNHRLFEVPSVVNAARLDELVASINAFSTASGIENRYFLLAPNSSYIYSSELPVNLNPDNQRDIIDNIYYQLAEKNVTVDVCMTLMNHKEENLYFRTDHHWSHHGSYYAFLRLAEEMKLDISEIEYEEIIFSDSFRGTLASSSGIYEATDVLGAYVPADSLGKYYVQNFTTQRKEASVFDLTKLNNKNQYEVFFGGNFSKIVIHTDNLNEQYLLVFKDSFANSLIPMLIPHFEKIVVIDPRYFTGNIKDVLEDDKFTHLLYLYNLNTFLSDTVLSDALS